MELKKKGFRGQKAQPVEAMANRLNWLGNRSTGCPCPVEVRSRDAQDLLSPNSLLFTVEVILFLVEVRSRTDRGLTVTRHAFNAQQLVNRSTPSSTSRDCLFGIMASEARNL